MDAYAKKYFAAQINGVFKKNMSLEKILNWQKVKEHLCQILSFETGHHQNAITSNRQGLTQRIFEVF